MGEDRVPLIDIAPWRLGGAEDKAAVAEAVDAACRDTGFFTVAGHGVPEALVAATRAASAAFFALPEDEKLASAPPPERKLPRGFSPVGNRSLSYTREVEAPPDLQESFAVGPVAPRGDGGGRQRHRPGLPRAQHLARPAGGVRGHGVGLCRGDGRARRHDHVDLRERARDRGGFLRRQDRPPTRACCGSPTTRPSPSRRAPAS